MHSLLHVMKVHRSAKRDHLLSFPNGCSLIRLPQLLSAKPMGLSHIYHSPLSFEIVLMAIERKAPRHLTRLIVFIYAFWVDLQSVTSDIESIIVFKYNIPKHNDLHLSSHTWVDDIVYKFPIKATARACGDREINRLELY